MIYTIFLIMLHFVMSSCDPGSLCLVQALPEIYTALLQPCTFYLYI